MEKLLKILQIEKEKEQIKISSGVKNEKNYKNKK